MKINVPFEKLRTIAHLADIHIRLFKRHEEYREAFHKLYDQLRNTDLSEGVIVVAGDIVHAKTDMSPEMVVLASEFLRNLADIAPTIVIAGNHDLNLSNMNRLDSLTPIIRNINHPNLHYFKNAGVYKVADADFAVMSILDDQEQWPSITDCEGKRKIALYHGPVHGATTDARYTITNRHVDVDTFNGFDMVLLGDIHRYQTLQARDVHAGKPVIVYPSSLIQQNHGESVDNHGWCLWNVGACSHTFQPLPNDYGYYTIEIKNGKVPFPTDVPKNVRLRIFTGNQDNTTTKKIVATLRKQYNIIELSINKSKHDSSVDRDKLKNNMEMMDVNNLNVQNQLIQDWLERTYETVSSPLLKNILNVNTQLNAQIKHDDQSRNVHWRPIQLKFSNMFSYGEDNIINFDNMKGIYGIFAQNASGKSSAMDALIFTLYDKTPRAFRGDHIMNNRKDEFVCQLKFEIDGEIFYIRRTGTRKKTGDVKVDVSFWQEHDDGSHVSLNGEDRRDTNANIRNYVGSYEDFVLTALSGQTSNALFIDKSHSERKDLLIQFMGLSIFDKLADAANDEMKEIAGALRKFKKVDFTQNLSDTQTKLEQTRNHHEKIDKLFVDVKQTRETLDAKLKEWQNQKRPVPNIELNLIKLEAKLDTIINNHAQYVEKRTDTEVIVDTLKEQIEQKNSIIQQNDVTQLQADAKSYDELSSVLVKGRNALKVTLTKLAEQEKFKTKLETYKFNPNCDVCVENNKSHIDDLQTATEEIAALTDIKQKQEEAVATITEQMVPLEEKKVIYEQMLTLQAEIKQLENKVMQKETELETISANIAKTNNQREQIEKDIELHHINEDNIRHNVGVEEHIEHINFDITTNKKQYESLERNLRDIHGEIKVLEAAKQDIMGQIKEAEDLENIYEAYKYYMNAVGRDGIPYELMSKAIPNIESEINNILTQIVDFTISLEVDGKNIVGKLNYDYDRIWPLENSSGMERFISSLAIRVALMNASNLPKSNFMIVDEGLGTLDVENLGSMHTLFGILKGHFDFLIIISHLDAVRDMVDNLIEIKREDGFSFINA
jgi:DNA repair exonuclease SbcCD ATPase subunit